MNKWIANDKAHTEEKGVSGVLGALEGAERWTGTMDTCLSIDDMEGLGSSEEDTEANERENADNTEDIQVAAQQLGGGDNAPDGYEGKEN